MLRRRRFRRALRLVATVAVAAAATASPAIAWAPDRPARILVGFAAGGTGDLIARTVAEMASPRLGQAVVVEEPRRRQRHDRRGGRRPRGARRPRPC